VTYLLDALNGRGARPQLLSRLAGELFRQWRQKGQTLSIPDAPRAV
jgi:hypothetical protein